LPSAFSYANDLKVARDLLRLALSVAVTRLTSYETALSSHDFWCALRRKGHTNRGSRGFQFSGCYIPGPRVLGMIRSESQRWGRTPNLRSE
jgi:hypothetical protein